MVLAARLLRPPEGEYDRGDGDKQDECCNRDESSYIDVSFYSYLL